MNVVHTPPVPKGSREASPDYWVRALGDGLVLGTFRDAEKNNFVFVANRDWQHESRAVLQFNRPIKTVEKFDKKTGEWMSLEIQTVDRFGNLTEELPTLEEINSVLGITNPVHVGEELNAFYHGIGYPLPYKTVTVMLAPGDGDLLRVKTVGLYTTGGR